MIIQILNTINDDIKQIRTDVFMKEQGFENEFDEIDENAKFVLLSIDGKAVGTCRFFPSDIEGDAHIGRMAVRKLYRGQNLGSKICLLRKMESVAMDLKHVLYQRKYRQNHSTNLLDMWLKVKNI